MPFILIALGVLIAVVAIRNTQSQLGAQLTADFTGGVNFFYWLAAIFIIGAFGYVDSLKAASRAMLALLIVVIVLANRGFFDKFVAQLKAGTATPPPPGPAAPGAAPASGPGSGMSTAGHPIPGANLIPLLSSVIPSLPL